MKHYAPGGNKVQKAIFNFKVMVKVTRSLTLVSLERVSHPKEIVLYNNPIENNIALYISAYFFPLFNSQVPCLT